MNILLIILAVIVWCIVGYFANIYTLKLGDWMQGYDSDIDSNSVNTCIVSSFIFPLFIFMVICFSLYHFDNPIFDNIAKWHNRSDK